MVDLDLDVAHKSLPVRLTADDIFRGITSRSIEAPRYNTSEKTMEQICIFMRDYKVPAEEIVKHLNAGGSYDQIFQTWSNVPSDEIVRCLEAGMSYDDIFQTWKDATRQKTVVEEYGCGSG